MNSFDNVIIVVVLVELASARAKSHGERHAFAADAIQGAFEVMVMPALSNPCDVVLVQHLLHLSKEFLGDDALMLCIRPSATAVVEVLSRVEVPAEHRSES